MQLANQKLVWEKEHISPKTFVRIHSDKPSSPVVEFSNFLHKKWLRINNKRILDLGCGKGRNSIYLATQGFKVIGIDFSKKAINDAIKKAKPSNKNLGFLPGDLTNKWPFDDKTFDAIIDTNTTICIPEPGRSKAISEIRRVLKSGGFYLFYGVAPSELLHKHPGPEENSAIFPKSGKFEKQYSKKELTDTYKDFELVRIKKKRGSDIIDGKLTKYSMWVALFQKK